MLLFLTLTFRSQNTECPHNFIRKILGHFKDEMAFPGY